MSSKKARRRERQEKKRAEGRRSGLSPVTLFMVTIGVAVVLVVVGAFVLGERSGRGEPPWPGAVWSAPHGHWH